MRFDGSWRLCDDGAVRPVMRAEILAPNGRWSQVNFMVDTGADQTVLSADVFVPLDMPAAADPRGLAGPGGTIASVFFDGRIRMQRETGEDIYFNGRFAGCTRKADLDMSVLGRDILNIFALIVDRQRDIVCLLGPGHSYSIAQA